MIATEFFFIADRGALKVYQLSTTRTRRPTFRLAETISINGSRKRFAEDFTDQAGSFKGSTGEPHNIEVEQRTRSFREVASKITQVLRANQPKRWSFAAPAEINPSILEGVPGEFQTRLKLNLKKDLVNAPAAEVLGHFRKAA